MIFAPTLVLLASALYFILYYPRRRQSPNQPYHSQRYVHPMPQMPDPFPGETSAEFAGRIELWREALNAYKTDLSAYKGEKPG